MRKLWLFIPLILLVFTACTSNSYRNCGCEIDTLQEVDEINLAGTTITFNEQSTLQFNDQLEKVTSILGKPKYYNESVWSRDSIKAMGLYFEPDINIIQFIQLENNVFPKKVKFDNEYTDIQFTLKENNITLSNETRIGELEELFPVSIKCLECDFIQKPYMQSERIAKMKLKTQDTDGQRSIMILTFNNGLLSEMEYQKGGLINNMFN